jgi:hypothetical protein
MMGYDAPTTIEYHDVAREKLVDWLCKRLDDRKNAAQVIDTTAVVDK